MLKILKPKRADARRLISDRARKAARGFIQGRDYQFAQKEELAILWERGYYAALKDVRAEINLPLPPICY